MYYIKGDKTDEMWVLQLPLNFAVRNLYILNNNFKQYGIICPPGVQHVRESLKATSTANSNAACNMY